MIVPIIFCITLIVLFILIGHYGGKKARRDFRKLGLLCQQTALLSLYKKLWDTDGAKIIYGELQKLDEQLLEFGFSPLTQRLDNPELLEGDK